MFRIYSVKEESGLKELRDLFAEGLGETTVEFWHWKHFMKNGLPESMLEAAEDENGKIVGMYAVQPIPYQCGDKKLLMIQDQDLVITPDMRGTGLMKQIRTFASEYCCERKSAAIMSYSNECSYPIFMKYGARDMGDIYGLRTKKTLVPLPFAKKTYQQNGWEITLAEKMPEDIAFTVSEICFKMVKTKEFMTWKFDQNPEQHFRWMVFRKNGKFMGYIVFHVNQGRFRKAVNIYDWDLFSEVTADILKHGVDILRGLGNWISLWGKYEKEIISLWEQAGLEEYHEKGTHFLLTPLTEWNLPENWHLTKADLDF